MREMLFRGKCVVTNQWIYGGYYKHLKRTPCPIGDKITESDYEHYIFTSGFSDWNMFCPVERRDIKPETVGQYTGLKDENGKKIFEGDIVGFIDTTYTDSGYYEQGFLGEVIWDEETVSFQVTNRLCAESYEVLDGCEVIGNIHETKLEVEGK